MRQSFLLIGLTLAGDECLLCRKSKTNKNSSGYESLRTCITGTCAECLLDYGNKNIDEYVSLKLAGLFVNEIIAKEFKYHPTCYKNVQRNSTQSHDSKDTMRNLREKCFEDVKCIIQNQVIENGGNIKLSALSEVQKEKLGLEIAEVQNRNLKERLKNTIGNQISFHQKAMGVREIICSTEKSNKVRLYDPIEIVKQAGRIIRKELLGYSEIYSECPLQKRDFCKTDLKRLHTQRLSCLLYYQVAFLRQNEVQGLSIFIAQDLLYSASNSRKRVPKLVQLGLPVKQKTRSIKVIIWLNHYGYCISYDEINATQTKLAEEQVHIPTAGRYIPNNIHRGLGVTFVYDNCDYNSESIYNVTVHGTNGIVIQMNNNNNNRKSNNKNIPPTRSTRNVQSIKRCYFKPVLQEVRPFIKPKKRPNPKPIQNVNNDINLLDGCISKCQDV